MGKEEKNTEGAQQTETNRGGASSDSNVNNSGPAAPEGETDRGESKEADKPGDATSDVPEAPSSRKEKEEKKSTAEDTAVTASENEDHEEISNPIAGGEGGKPMAVVSHGKKDRPTYKYDPNKITLRFLFANRDGLTVTCECKPSDTVGEVKGALLSVWPSDLPDCEGGDLLRLVCMGKGFLMPDSRTLEDLQVPVFKTHPTPVNVSVKPTAKGPSSGDTPTKKEGGGELAVNSGETTAASQGCSCTIL